MREKNNRFTKVIAIMLSVAMVLGMLPNSFVTAFAAEKQMGTLSSITSGGRVSDAQGKEATVKFEEETVKLNWSAADATIGRNKDGWWLGIKMTAPSSMTKAEDFTDVYYQTGNGENWSANKNFWNAQDSNKNIEDTERYITLWGIVDEEILNEAINGGKTVDYRWQFDWDADGTFEQRAIMTIDPSKVELAKNGSIVYPSVEVNGKVSAISEGLSVKETNSSHIIKALHESEQTLTWCAADTTIGRNKDGWWAGIKVVAPTDLEDSVLEGAKYERLIYGQSDWTSDLSFWNNKDSKVGDASHHIEMWMYLTPDILANAFEAGENVTNQYRFDWDGDGVCEQCVIFEINPEKVILNDADNKQVYPELGTVTPITNGTVSGVTGNKVVTVEEVMLNWSPADTSIGRNKDGWWAGIKVTAPEDLDASVLEGAAYERLIYGQTEWEVGKSFWNNKDSKAGDATHYIGMWMYLTPAILKEATEAGKNVTNQYRFDWNGDGVYEQLITFTVVPSDKIVLVKENQTAIAFENVPDSFVYGETPEPIKVTGGNGEGVLSYEITDGIDVATVDATGALALLKAGTFTLKVVKAGDDTYNDGVAITKTITVEPADQTGFEFEDKKPADITYNDNGNKYTNVAAGGQSVGAVTYEIISGSDVADISKTTGELTIKKAGVVTVTATKAEDDKYKVAIAEYTIIIDKAEQEIAFANGSEIDVTYGTLTYSNIAKEVGDLYGTKIITYEVTSGNDIASVDSTGIVTFIDKKVGTVTIKASKAEDDCYKECTAEYTLKVQYLATPENAYALDGETKNNSGWYTGDVTIKAPEGYEISYSNAITGNEWSEVVVWTEEGIHDVEVYLCDVDGAITDKIIIEDLKVDKTPAKDLKIEYTKSTIKKFFEKLTFGIYTAPVKVTISATDDVSGISKFEYTYKNAGETTFVDLKSAGNSASFSFDIQPQFRDTITFAVEDIAGNTTEKVDMEVDENGNETGRENVIVIDTTDSKLDTVYTYATNDYATDKEGVIYTQGDVSIQWTISESNFDLADKPIVIVNGVEETSVTWSQNGVGTLELSGNGDYKVKMTFTDATKAVNIVYEQEIRIDEIAPEIIVDPVIEQINNSADKIYYNGPKTFKLTVNEHNFDLDDLTVNVIPSNVLEGVEVQDYAVKTKDASQWQHNGDTHSVLVTFEEDAQYQVILNYKDLSGRTDSYVTKEFIIDNKNPEIDIKIAPVLEGSKYYNTKRTATITVTEHNFDASRMVINVAATDKLDETVSIEDYQAKLTDPTKWIQEGDVYTTTIDFTVDAKYKWTLDCADLAGRVAAQYVSEEFVIDNKNPEIDVKIAPVLEDSKYYNTKRTATITVTEHNFDASRMVINVAATDKLDETAVIEDYQAKLTDPTKWTSNGDVHTTTIDFTVDAKYKWTLDCTDLAERKATQYESEEYVIDNVDPVIQVDVTPKEDMASNEKYHNVKRTAEITITEHNFDASNIVINVSATRKLDETALIEDYQATLADSTKWTSNGDVHKATIEFTVDANYQWTLDYTDLAKRAAAQYASEEFVIDNVDPKLVSIEYTNKEAVVTNEEGREYVDIADDEMVSAVITINEHNFDAKDVNIVVKAKDAADKNVLLAGEKDTLEAYYNAKFKNAAAWTSNGDVHTATIEFKQDANYSFDINFVDLANRSINSTVDREEDLFTIDRVAPTNLKATYSDSVYDTTVDGKDYEYYADKMTVTISGEDATSGIHKFMYSYLNDIGVSTVNASGSGEIKVEKIVQNGYTFTTTFTIPKEALSADKQFNGTIEFTALDVIENSTRQVEQKRIVVDNIAPTAQITYSDPVKNANGISYYAGDINGKIVINEANFYSEDVEMVVTKDGNVVPVTITWVDNSVDQHTGTFTLHDDGDYIVTINYADRSTNKISTYMSNELTIDTKQPSVSVSNIKMNSANKDETYGFTITANDINFDASTFKPVLQAVVRGEDGSYSTKTISLGDMAGTQDGQTYSYTVQNLEEDGIYTLTCAVKDMSDNAYASIRLEDGREYETVQFSINRDGSTFGINEYTEEVINQYYIYSVDKDIVLVEINADPITNYSVIVNGKVLESNEYTTDMTGGNGEWYKRTYTIPKAMFEVEGEYNIVVRSTDKAETEAYSDVKNIKVAFVVDQTAPVLTISGLDTEGRYQTNEQTVTVIPTDDGGRLYSFKAIVYDNDGNPLKDENGKDISVRFEMEGEELLKYLEEHDGKITFTVPEGYQNNVQIICTDCAKNSEGTTNTFNETFEKVTVSASQIVIFYANKPLFYGTVAGLVAIIGGIVFVVYKKRKKEEK